MTALVNAFPRSWKPKGTEWQGIVDMHRKIRGDLLEFGETNGWSLMGQASTYVRPHVGRKLWLLLCAAAGRSDATWGTLHGPPVGVMEFTQMFPDVKEFVTKTPIQWKTSMRYIRAMGPHTSPSMHSCWTCLINYATNSNMLGEDLRKDVREFITEALRQMDTASGGGSAPAALANGGGSFPAAGAPSSALQKFSECRSRLQATRSCVPTPLMVLRACVQGQPAADNGHQELMEPEPPSAPPQRRRQKSSEPSLAAPATQAAAVAATVFQRHKRQQGVATQAAKRHVRR